MKTNKMTAFWVILSMSLGLFSSSLSFAKPGEMRKLKDAYPQKAAEINCKTCHTSGKELNDYGKLFKEKGIQAELK